MGFIIIMHNIILITGASGFIGSHLMRAFPGAIALERSYLFDVKKLTTFCKKICPDVILHLAAYGTREADNDPELVQKVNVQGTLNLLLATKDIPYRAFINTGSSSEYGFKKKPMKETDVLEPVSFYGASKASATLLCQVYAQQHTKPIMTLRPFSVYGPREPENRLIPTIIRALKTTTPIRVTSAPIRRDFVYIDDVVDAYKRAIEKPMPGEIFNVGTGVHYTNLEVVETLFRVIGKSVLVKDFPKRYWDTEYWKADISKIQHILGWKPKFSLSTGLKKMYEF
jgi:nucleoside-diphosphate-sugar epimerase